MGRHGEGARRRVGSGPWTTILTPAFRRDVAEQVQWLVEQDREAWAKDLKRALRSARSILERNPALVLADDAGVRRLLLGRLPLFLWYRLNVGDRKVVWLRLFHVRHSRAR